MKEKKKLPMAKTTFKIQIAKHTFHINFALNYLFRLAAEDAQSKLFIQEACSDFQTHNT